MASAIDSTSNEDPDLRLSWSGRWTLSHRILALNLLTVLLVALSTLYLDVFRNRLSKERVRQTRIAASATALAIEAAGPEDGEPILAKVTKSTGSRMRLYSPDGRLLADSWHLTGPTYELKDPNTQKWTKDVARALDRGFNAIVGAKQLDEFVEPKVDQLKAWPEAALAQRTAKAVTAVRNAPDLTPVISAAVVAIPVDDRERRTIKPLFLPCLAEERESILRFDASICVLNLRTPHALLRFQNRQWQGSNARSLPSLVRDKLERLFIALQLVLFELFNFFLVLRLRTGIRTASSEQRQQQAQRQDGAQQAAGSRTCIHGSLLQQCRIYGSFTRFAAMSAATTPHGLLALKPPVRVVVAFTS